MKQYVRNHYRDRVCLRLLQRQDLPHTLIWRNKNRKCFRDPRLILWGDHLKWFEDYAQKDDDFVFVATKNGERIGQAAIYNIYWPDGIGEIGRFVVAPEAASNGYMTTACELLKKIARSSLGLKLLHLEVFKNNKAAIHVYQKAGFKEYRFDDDFIYMMCCLES